MQLNRRDFSRLAATTAAAAVLPSALHAQKPSSGDVTSLSLTEVSARIHKREISSVEATQACLDRIALYNPKVDAFITVMTEFALAQARQLDAELKAGKSRGPLHGVPIGLKDNIDTVGTRTTGGSAVFEDRVPIEDAPVVTRLKNSGAVILGKTNMYEFAGLALQSYYGYARNPWNLARDTGGSSSGSGSAVSSALCFGALGTDTGGSVRIPASFCGVVGLKVTAGRVPIRGIIPLTPTLDTCGPLTRRVEDAAILLTSMAGYDKLDIISVDHPTEDYTAAIKQPVKGMRIGLPVGHYDNMLPATAAAFAAAIKVLTSLTGVEAREMQLPSIAYNSPITPISEAYAWQEPYFTTQPNKYQPNARKQLNANAKNLAAPYIRGMWNLELLRRTVDDSFQDVDVVALPTIKRAPAILKNPTAADLAAPPPAPAPYDSSLFNLTGLPAISIPCGFDQDGMPIGLEIGGPHFSEARILSLAAAYQNATDWHSKRPPLTPDMPVPEVV